MKNAEDEILNRRMKLWREVGPFYLDFYEGVQLPFHLGDVRWARPLSHSSDPEAATLQLAFSAQSDNTSFISVAGLLYPNEDAETFSPDELLNFDRELTSLLPL